MMRQRDGELLEHLTLSSSKKVTDRFKKLVREFSQNEIDSGGGKQTHEQFLVYLLDLHETDWKQLTEAEES